MRILFWTCTLALFFAPFVSAQNYEQLRKIIDDNMPAIKLDELGLQPPTQENISASKAVFEAATQIYALPNLSAEDHQRILQREAFALMVLAYADTPTYYPKLTLISDELDKRGLPKIAKATERHVLEIGGDLATRTGNKNANLNVASLAERMVMYAEQHPGQESTQVIDHFLQRIRKMPNAQRDRRLAVAAPIFQEYFKKINFAPKADALNPDILRSTLPGKDMILMGVDIDGKELDWYALKGKVVLVQFWGVWCANCIAEMSDLIDLYEKYHHAGFEIIGVNTGVQGDDVKKVKQFVDTKTFDGKKIPWTILHEGLGQSKNNTTMTKIYGIDELPVLILVGKNGKVLNLHPLPAMLDELVGNATSIFADLSEDDKKVIEEAKKKQQEAIDEQFEKDISTPK